VRHRLLAAVATAAALLAAPAGAGAHAQLLRAEPADGAALAAAPAVVRLVFSEPVVAARSTIDLYGSDGHHWRVAARLAGATLTAAAPQLAEGGYRLVWRSLSADDLHAVGGEVVFGVGPTATPPRAHPIREPVPAPGETLLRWSALACLALLQGLLVLRLLGEPPPARAVRSAGAGAALGTVAIVVLEARTAGSFGVVAASGAGRGAATVLTGLAVASGLAIRRPGAALAAAVTASAAFALGAHATAFGIVATALLAVHIACATLWAGTVVAAALALRRGVRSGILRRLAPVLVACVAGLVVTGLLEAGRHVATVDALATTIYGRLIVLKTALLLVAGALALGTRAALRRGAGGRLRAVPAEACVLLVALALAAALAAGAPAVGPQFAAVSSAAPSVLETRQAGDLLVSVEVRPNRPGNGFVTIRTIETRRPAPAPIAGVRLGVGGAELAARRIADGTWQVAGVGLARPGALPLQVEVDRPGLPVRVGVDWVVGGAPPRAAPMLSRRRLAPIVTALALVAAAVALLGLAAARRRAPIVVAMLLLAAAIPAAASAATDPTVSVIVTVRGGSSPPTFASSPAGGLERGLRAGLERHGSGLRRFLAGRAWRVEPLWIAHGYAITARASVVEALRRRPDVVAVAADTTGLRPMAEPGIELLRAPSVWLHADSGVLAGTTGDGVAVAVLDTGLDADGPLAARFRGQAGDWFDAYGTYPSPADAAGPCSGHGTAVAGVVAGGADDGGVAYGVAPGARLLAARIFDGTCRASVSAVHAAFQWALDPDGDPDTADAPAVVNASWGEVATGCPTTFAPDLAALRAAGVVVVVAAGNDTLPESPAMLSDALAVGALAADGTTARPESARGTSPCDGRPFPDLSAPGTDVRTADRAGGWQTVSGTSVAAPHVTGLLALLAARHPGMTAAEQVAAVTATAVPLAAPGTGAGRADALAAFEAPLPAPRDRTAPLLSAATAAPAVTATQAVTVRSRATDAVPDAPVAGIVVRAEVVLDGRPAEAAPVAANGTISVPVAVGGLPEGAHALTLRVVDDSGNVSRSRSVAFTIDRSPPALGALELVRDADGRVTGMVAGVDRTAIVAVEAAGGTVTPADGALGGAREMLVVRADGRSWGSGRHTIGVRTRDAAGTWSAWRTGAVVVARLLRDDGFEHGLGGWTVHGRIVATRSAALSGRRGLDVRAGRRPAYLQDTAPVAERALDVTLRLRVRRLRGTLRLLELAGAARPVAALEVRRGRVRLAGGRWVALRRGTVRIGITLRNGRATLLLDGRRRTSATAPGSVEALRLGALRAGDGAVAVDAFRAVRV
jgi:methionine-rich copper-binding protein CopC/subtilisin family serine protease/putative copper export protein